MNATRSPEQHTELSWVCPGSSVHPFKRSSGTAAIAAGRGPRPLDFAAPTSYYPTSTPDFHPGPRPERHMHPFIETQKEWLRNVPPFRPGDTLRVNVRVKEGEKERIQAFEGVCIARRGAGVSETFTVRKISNGVGVERIFPVHSPMLAEINVVRRGRVRRAKLYYLRNLTGKATRIREKKVRVAVPETGAPAAAE